MVLDSICGHVWGKAGSLARMCVHVSEDISISGIIIIIMFIGHLTLCQRLCMYYLISFNPSDNIVRRILLLLIFQMRKPAKAALLAKVAQLLTAGSDAAGDSKGLPSHL